ncbi:HPP family protein [Pandoraea sp.]|nr:HPP family protein [Pandoraea sp.]
MASLAFLGGVAQTALVTTVPYMLFPELAALAYDVFTRPRGLWARSPVMLVLTPSLAAAVGTLVTRNMPYDLASMALCVVGAMLIIRLLRSPVAPAISAAFLPLALNVPSWWYPVSIAASTGTLATLSIAYRRSLAVRLEHAPDVSADVMDDEMESAPKRYVWVPIFAAFLGLTYTLSVVTGLRLILFPPLIVIGFEMFAHANICPWAGRPFALPLACTVTAAAGLSAFLFFGAGPLSVAIAMLIGISILRLLRLHIPPALAVGLLPQVMPHADWWFPLAVAAGTLTLTATFIVSRPLLLDLVDPTWIRPDQDRARRVQSPNNANLCNARDFRPTNQSNEIASMPSTRRSATIAHRNSEGSTAKPINRERCDYCPACNRPEQGTCRPNIGTTRCCEDRAPSS